MRLSNWKVRSSLTRAINKFWWITVLHYDNQLQSADVRCSTRKLIVIPNFTDSLFFIDISDCSHKHSRTLEWNKIYQNWQHFASKPSCIQQHREVCRLHKDCPLSPCCRGGWWVVALFQFVCRVHLPDAAIRWSIRDSVPLAPTNDRSNSVFCTSQPQPCYAVYIFTTDLKLDKLTTHCGCALLVGVTQTPLTEFTTDYKTWHHDIPKYCKQYSFCGSLVQS